MEGGGVNLMLTAFAIMIIISMYGKYIVIFFLICVLSALVIYLAKKFFEAIKKESEESKEREQEKERKRREQIENKRRAITDLLHDFESQFRYQSEQEKLVENLKKCLAKDVYAYPYNSEDDPYEPYDSYDPYGSYNIYDDDYSYYPDDNYDPYDHDYKTDYEKYDTYGVHSAIDPASYECGEYLEALKQKGVDAWLQSYMPLIKRAGMFCPEANELIFDGNFSIDDIIGLMGELEALLEKMSAASS